MVPNMSKLDGYPWCGHAVIMGRKKHDWQDRGYVLKRFGKNIFKTKKPALSFVAVRVRPQDCALMYV
jgi:hypothetical protein